MKVGIFQDAKIWREVSRLLDGNIYVSIAYKLAYYDE